MSTARGGARGEVFPIVNQDQLDDRLSDRLTRQRQRLLDQAQATARATADVHAAHIARLHAVIVDAEARAAAAAAGFIDPDVAVRLAGVEGITVDPLGDVVEADELDQRLAALAARSPHLLHHPGTQQHSAPTPHEVTTP